jgi:hypothetical protein
LFMVRAEIPFLVRERSHSTPIFAVRESALRQKQIGAIG